MSAGPFRGVIASDFNVANFAAALHNNDEPPVVTATLAAPGQVASALAAEAACRRDEQDFVVIWTQPESVIPSLGEALRYEVVDVDRALEEVEAFAALVGDVATRARQVFVPSWVLPPHIREFGLLDLRPGIGLSHLLMRMNMRLADACEDKPGVHLLNTGRWVQLAGKHAFNPRLWYMGKIPFGPEVFLEAARDVKSALRGLCGESRKLLLVDLDDTLWGGIVGDIGWENLALGGHDPAGEAFVDFQRSLKALTNRGVLLGIVSKNDEAVALEAIDRHPEMVLRREDFVGWRINWRDKAENIVDLVEGLNLGLQSAVFIDDSPVERARVKAALPEVLVPEWPGDKLLYPSSLRSQVWFNPPSVTEEDVARTASYLVEKKRESLKRQIASPEEWLATLGVNVRTETLNQGNLRRAVQLLNKTNQLNLTTRRMNEAELLEWAADPRNRLWTFRVSDRFGDSGLTGLASLTMEGKIGTIVDFVLSCRVMGRKVEETMVAVLVAQARDAGAERVIARYLPTSKNRPCLEFWHRSGFAQEEPDSVFVWDARAPYPLLGPVAIQGEAV